MLGTMQVTGPSSTRTMFERHLLNWRLMVYSCLFYGNMIAFGAFYNYFDYMARRGDTRTLPTGGPVNDDGHILFIAGYHKAQEMFECSWFEDPLTMTSDEWFAAHSAISVFFVTIALGQIGHFLSVRQRRPYFIGGWRIATVTRDVVMNAMCALIGVVVAISTTWVFTELHVFQINCGTTSVNARYWGMAISWSVLWFMVAESRKWWIEWRPDSWVARLDW